MPAIAPLPAPADFHSARPLGVDHAARFVTARTDLNGDGRPETIAYAVDPAFCGTGGCNLHVIDGASGRLVARITVAHPPVQVMTSRSHGWRDLSVQVSGGGTTAYRARLSFNGQRYAYAGLAPATLAVGRTLISSEVVKAAFAEWHAP